MSVGSLATPRRRLVVYACAVAGPTLVVLALGLQAVARQRDALAAQTQVTARLQEARIADQVERRAAMAAEAALRALEDPAILGAALSGDPERQARLWPMVRSILQSHPVARAAFVSDGGTVLYPPSSPSVPQLVDSWLLGEAGPSARRARALFDAAARLDDGARWTEAARLYASGARLDVSPRLQAVALARAARAFQRGGDVPAAVTAYTNLRSEHGDRYDLAGRPHALVAALELREMLDRPDAQQASILESVPGDLLAGRWAVDAGSAEYFLAELTGQVGSTRSSAYLDALDFARRVQSGLRAPTTPATATTYHASLPGPPADHLVYRVSPRPNGEGHMLTGVAANVSWVEHTLLPDVAQAIAPGDRASLTTASNRGTRLGPALEGLAVVLTPHVPANGSWSGDVVTLVLITAAVLGLLLLGVVLLLKDVSRETELNSLRANLVGAVSHDLRTPLSVMRVYAETIADTPDLAPDDRRRYANVIAQETERLAQRISSAIDFTRVESGARSYRIETVLLQPVVREVVDGYRPFLERQGYDVRVSLDEDLPPVHIDREAASQALLNLLDNAFKYSGDSRVIEVRLSRVAKSACLEVQDGGPGIPVEDRSRLLERFERGRRHPDRGGYGLGLYLVAHTMRAHGGVVQIDGGVPSGTVVRLLFPLPRGE